MIVSNKNPGLFALSILICSLLLVSSAFGQKRRIAKKFERYVKNSEVLNEGHFGVVIQDIESKEIVFNKNEYKGFTPASNAKLLTVFAAINLMQDSVSTFQFLQNRQNLYLKPTIDPTFLNPYFRNQKVINWLRVQAIDTIFVHNPNLVPKYGKGWMWDDVWDWYNQQLSDFPIYNNTLFASVDSLGLHYIYPLILEDSVEIKHDISILKIRKPKRSWEKNDFIWKIPSFEYGQTYKADTFETPFVYSNLLLKKSLKEEIGSNIEIVISNDNLDFTRVKRDFSLADKSTIFSFPLDSLLKRVLVNSDNFVAECIFHKMINGYDLKVKHETNFKKDKKTLLIASGLDKSDRILQNLRWVDGSGLSNYNQVTPELISNLLFKIYSQKDQQWIKDHFAIGGQSGTIKKWFKNTSNPSSPFVFAKTGTLTGVHNVSGFLITDSGKWMIFSFLLNNHSSPNKKVREEFRNLLNIIKCY